MKKMKSKNLFAIIGLITISIIAIQCKNIKKNKIDSTTNNHLEIIMNGLENQFLDEDQIFDTTDIKYIQLETNDSSMFGNVDKLIVDNGYIFILDRNISKALFVFNMEGKFITRIGTQGKGPGEYLSLVDFDIAFDEKQLVLYDLWTRKIIFYTYEGDYIKETFLKKYLGSPFACINTNRFAFFMSRPHEGAHGQLLITDSLGNIISQHFPWMSTNKITQFGMYDYFARSGRNIYFIPIWNDKLCKIGPDLKIEEVFDFQIKNLMVNQKDVININNVEDLFKIDKFSFFDRLTVNGDHFICFNSKGNKPISLIGDLKTGKLLAANFLYDENKDRPYSVHYPIASYYDYIVTPAHPIYLVKYRKNIFPNAQMDDNYYLIFYKLKDLNRYKE